MRFFKLLIILQVIVVLAGCASKTGNTLEDKSLEEIRDFLANRNSTKEAINPNSGLEVSICKS